MSNVAERWSYVLRWSTATTYEAWWRSCCHSSRNVIRSSSPTAHPVWSLLPKSQFVIVTVGFIYIYISIYKVPYGRNFRGAVSFLRLPKPLPVLIAPTQAEWAWVAWINTRMVDPPKVVTIPSTNRVRHSLTLFLWWMLLPLRQTSHQGCWGMSGQLLIMGWFLIVCASSRPLKFKFHLSLHDTTCYLAHAFCPKNSSTCCVCSVVLAWI